LLDGIENTGYPALTKGRGRIGRPGLASGLPDRDRWPAAGSITKGSLTEGLPGSRRIAWPGNGPKA